MKYTSDTLMAFLLMSPLAFIAGFAFLVMIDQTNGQIASEEWSSYRTSIAR